MALISGELLTELFAFYIHSVIYLRLHLKVLSRLLSIRYRLQYCVIYCSGSIIKLTLTVLSRLLLKVPVRKIFLKILIHINVGRIFEGSDSSTIRRILFKVPVQVLSGEYHFRFWFKYYPENIISGSGSSTIRRILFPVPVQVLSREHYFRFRFKYYPENVADEIIQDNTHRLLYLQVSGDDKF